MRLPEDEEHAHGGVPNAQRGRLNEAFGELLIRPGRAPNRERGGGTAPGAANARAFLDRVVTPRGAERMGSARADHPRHSPQAGASEAIASPMVIDGARRAEPGNGRAAAGRGVAPVAAVRPPQASAAPSAHRAPVAYAGLQLLLGYAWLLAGVDKILLGNFPIQLAQILVGTLRGTTIPGFFAAFLRAVVLPNSALFGLMVEYGETLAGLGLIAAGLVILVGPPLEQRSVPPLARSIALVRRLLVALGVPAAIGAALLGATYYLLDGAPSQGFMPSVAFNGALDPGLQLALGSVLLLMAALFTRTRRRPQPREVRGAPVRHEGAA